MSMWLTLLGLLPEALKLVNRLFAYVEAKEQQGIGRQAAMVEALTAAREDMDKSIAAISAAEDKHRADPTDAAFDDKFQRKD